MSGREFKTGIYGRTSKDDQRRVTIENQQATLRQWGAIDTEAKIVDEYWDKGVSGKIPLWERPAGKLLMNDIRTRKLDAVAVAYADRFGRTLLDGLQAVKELETLGAKLTCVSEGWDARRNDSPLYMQFRFMIAEEEHRRIKERMETGKVRAAARDNAPPGGSLTFGFRMGERGEYLLHPDEAPFVVLIFERFLRGESVCSIAQWMDTSGISAGQKFQKRGSLDIRIRADHVGTRWTRLKVRDILLNPCYLGTRLWKGQSFPCPALIDPASFHSVQERFACRATGLSKSSLDGALLSGMFKCGKCKGTYYRHLSRNIKRGESRNYYSCENSKCKKPGATYCPGKVVSVEWLDAQVWGMLEEYLRKPEELIRRLVQADSGRSAQAGEIAEGLQQAETASAALDSQVEAIWEEQRVNGWPIAWVSSRINALAIQKQSLDAQIKGLRQRHSQVTFSRQDSSHVLAEVARLRCRLDDGLTAAEQAAFIRDVWAGGVIDTEGSRWKKTAKIHFEFKWSELAVAPNVGQNLCQTTEGVATLPFVVQTGRAVAG